MRVFDAIRRWLQGAHSMFHCACALVSTIAPLLFICATSEALVPAGVENRETRREIVDPCLGMRWQLRADPQHPGGPAHLVLLEQSSVSRGPAMSIAGSRDAGLPLGSRPSMPVPSLVLRAGQTVVVEQRSKNLNAVLQGVALESAAVGQRVHVRLSIGRGFQAGSIGATISVIATGNGTAEWSSRSEERP